MQVYLTVGRGQMQVYLTVGRVQMQVNLTVGRGQMQVTYRPTCCLSSVEVLPSSGVLVKGDFLVRRPRLMVRFRENLGLLHARRQEERSVRVSTLPNKVTPTHITTLYLQNLGPANLQIKTGKMYVLHKYTPVHFTNMCTTIKHFTNDKGSGDIHFG